MVRSRHPTSLFGESSLQMKGKTTFLIFPRDLGLFASGWVASDGVLPHSIFCCSVWNRKSSSTETWYSWTRWKWKKKVLITWTASSLSIRTGLYFFTHEKHALRLFSPSVKPSRRAHFQDLKYIHQLSWFVHKKQNIFYFCQLWKGHSSLMPLCWFFWAFDFYELCFWAWWFQPHCGSGQQAGLPPGVVFFICLCNPPWAPWQVLAQQLPPTHHRALSGAVQASSSCTVVPTHALSFVVSFPIFPPTLSTLFLPSPASVLFFPFCTSPRCLFQAALPQLDVSRRWRCPQCHHSGLEPSRASKRSPLPDPVPTTCFSHLRLNKYYAVHVATSGY